MHEDKTLREKLDWLFRVVDKPLAIHEVPGEYEVWADTKIGHSENSIAACMRTMTQEHVLANHRREDKPFKEWWLFQTDNKGQGVLI